MAADKFEHNLSLALVKLLQGPVYSDKRDLWNTVLTRRSAIRDYFKKIGLELFLDEAEGYGFLRSSENVEGGDDTDESQSQPLPRLIRRRPLAYDQTLLLVLLREALEHFDVGSTDDHRLVLSKQAIFDMITPYFPERTDQAKDFKRLDALMQKAIEMGVIKPLQSGPDVFEVRRIIKAIVQADILEEIKQQLGEHISAETTATGEA